MIDWAALASTIAVKPEVEHHRQDDDQRHRDAGDGAGDGRGVPPLLGDQVGACRHGRRAERQWQEDQQRDALALQAPAGAGVDGERQREPDDGREQRQADPDREQAVHQPLAVGRALGQFARPDRPDAHVRERHQQRRERRDRHERSEEVRAEVAGRDAEADDAQARVDQAPDRQRGGVDGDEPREPAGLFARRLIQRRQ